MIFKRLRLWLDPVKRQGPEAMAVDEWLLLHTEQPVLRVYGWSGAWGSVGYFGNLTEAKASFPGLDWVRRWTGGGTVDHRSDWTYTVVVPAGETVASLRGAESYLEIHRALASCLGLEGTGARLSTGGEETGAAVCFENPVSHDLVSEGGRKLAGAGQRRTKQGLLHQGSVASACCGEPCRLRSHALADCLAESWSIQEFRPPDEDLGKLISIRYGRDSWTARR